jgi:hypothetical protein
MSARSMRITVHNTTGANLSLATPVKDNDSNLEHGAWIIPPPVNIPPSSNGTFEAGSFGFMTGVEGTIKYAADKGGEFTIHFDDPFAGSNELEISCPQWATAQCGDISGNNADVDVFVAAN